LTTHPTTVELVDALVGFVEGVCAPHLRDRDAFLARVAVNALGVIRRELEQGQALEAAAAARLTRLLGREGDYTGLNRALCEAIRTGELGMSTPGLLAHLKAETMDRVAIDQPKYAGLKAALATGRPSDPPAP
jgi:hypothetical protein